MKQSYLSLVLFILSFVAQAQTTTLTYNKSGAGGAENSSSFQVKLDNLTTCQNSVSLNVNGTGYNVSTYPVKYKVIVNNTTTIATMQYGNNTYNLDAYMPVTSILVRGDGNISAWIVLNATLSINSPTASMPSTGPTVNNVTYIQNETASPLTATLTNTGTTLKWYTSENGQNYSATALTPLTTVLGETAYWVAQSNSVGCESVRSRIIVNVIPNTPGTHLNLDGSNDYVQIPKTFTEDFTIEYLVKTNQTGANGTQWFNGNSIVDAEFAGVTNDFGTSLLGSKLAFGIGNPDKTLISTTNINDGTWKHVAVSWKKSTGEMKLYIDGVLEASDIGSTNTRTAHNNIYIGTNTYLGNFTNLEIDELRIWGEVRTPQNIEAYKNCELNGNETNLLNYYKFNQGIASANNPNITTLQCATATTCNGSLTNFTLNGNTSNWLTGSPIQSGIVCASLSNDQFLTTNLKLFPNPTNGKLTIQTNSHLTINVYNILGNKVLTQKIDPQNNMLNLTNLANGVYIIKATNNIGNTQSFKIIKN